MTDTVRLPVSRTPFGVGPTFEIVVPTDVHSFHGNLVTRAGRYEAQQTRNAPEGVVTVWSPDHYAGALWVSLAVTDWTFPGEDPRPIPVHDCLSPEKLRSGVAGGVFCGVCKREVSL